MSKHGNTHTHAHANAQTHTHTQERKVFAFNSKQMIMNVCVPILYNTY